MHTITYQERPRAGREFWAHYAGTRAEAERCAVGMLLDSLVVDDGLKRARVFVDGKRVRGARGAERGEVTEAAGTTEKKNKKQNVNSRAAPGRRGDTCASSCASAQLSLFDGGEL